MMETSTKNIDFNDNNVYMIIMISALIIPVGVKIIT